jgi:hypothetical protein
MTFTQFVKLSIKNIQNYFAPRQDFKRTIEILFRDFQTGCSNLLGWFPIIWCDRYWDSHYLFKIIRKKLIGMERDIRENGIHEDASKDADNILICINALNRLIANNYSEIAFKEHDEKWGELQWNTSPSEGDPRLHQMHFYRKNAITPEQIQQEIDESKVGWEREHKMQQDDLDTLFKTMREEVLKWWD